MPTSSRSRLRLTLVVSTLVVAVSCTAMRTGAPAATAVLADSAGRTVGTLTLRQPVGEPLLLEGEVQGLAPGTHGIHFHAVGQCVGANGFASAGGHFNPASRKHGLENADGPHAGDLPNVVVGADGRGTVRATSSRVTLGRDASSLLDADGSAVVVHAAADDQRTDPSGNSGARVACGVVTSR